MSVKLCTKCKTEKPIEEFYGNRPDCKACKKASVMKLHFATPAETRQARDKEKYAKNRDEQLAYHTAYREKNREYLKLYAREYRRAHPERSDDDKRKHLYGMDRGQYAAMLAAQGGKCACCGTDKPGTKEARKGTFCVDHDHTTGKIRALLCNNCNLAAGHVQDSPARADQLAAYLRQGR